MLTKAAKNEVVEHYSGVFKANPSVVVVDYKGLTVAELEGLRSNLKDADAKLQVVKNTLLKIAAKDTEIEQISDLLSGPTAIAVCESDPTAAAKIFVESAKDIPQLEIKGGIVEGNVVSVDEITALSKLPSRQEMMSQLLGILTSPMSGLLGTLNQLQTKLLYALEAVKDTKSATAQEAPKEESKAETPQEAKTEAKDESAVEAKEEAAPEVKEVKEESAVEASGESEVEAKEGNEEENKEES